MTNIEVIATLLEIKGTSDIDARNILIDSLISEFVEEETK